MLGVITAGVWVWGIALFWLEAFPTLEEAVYFSLVAYTTLGLGDLVPSSEWRLLAGMEAANGFLNFGLLTALLMLWLAWAAIGWELMFSRWDAPDWLAGREPPTPLLQKQPYS